METRFEYTPPTIGKFGAEGTIYIPFFGNVSYTVTIGILIVMVVAIYLGWYYWWRKEDFDLYNYDNPYTANNESSMLTL